MGTRRSRPSVKPLDDDVLGHAIRDGLLATGVKPKDEFAGERPFAGLCSVAAETYLYLSGDRRESGLRPTLLKSRRYDHWWLQDSDGDVIDITREQFRRPERIPYEDGRPQWFGSTYPSSRAVTVIEWVRANRPEVIRNGEDRPSGRSRLNPRE